MLSPLANRVALITGGSSGLGAATARAFAAMQMRVIINYSSDSERANALVKELYQISESLDEDEKPDTANRFLAIKADVTSQSEIRRLVDMSVSTMGRLDVVFSNHGWTRLTNFSSLDENVNDADWDRCFNLNVKSHLYLLHAAREHLDLSEGSFIVTSSVAGVRAAGSSLAYAVTKAGQIHLVKCLAGIVSPKVRVNCVSPGMMMTPWSATFPETKRNTTVAKTKLGRLTSVEDVTQQVCTFALSRSVTGENAVIDCGFSI